MSFVPPNAQVLRLMRWRSEIERKKKGYDRMSDAPMLNLVRSSLFSEGLHGHDSLGYTANGFTVHDIDTMKLDTIVG